MDSLVDAFKRCPSLSRNYLCFQPFKVHREREEERECSSESKRSGKYFHAFRAGVQTRASFENIAKPAIAIVYRLNRGKIVPTDREMSSDS
jgi:hypothetical protein